MLRQDWGDVLHYPRFVIPVACILRLISGLVPDLEAGQHTHKDHLLVDARIFAKHGRNQYSALGIELTHFHSRDEAPHKGPMVGMNLREIFRPGFDLFPLLGRIGDQTILHSGDKESIGKMFLQDFPELGGDPQSALGVYPGGRATSKFG